MGDALKRLLANIDVKQAAAHVFSPCGVEVCDKLSLGIVCSSCSRPMCNGHTYFRLGTPPVPICAACVVSSHPELFEEG